MGVGELVAVDGHCAGEVDDQCDFGYLGWFKTSHMGDDEPAPRMHYHDDEHHDKRCVEYPAEGFGKVSEFDMGYEDDSEVGEQDEGEMLEEYLHGSRVEVGNGRESNGAIYSNKGYAAEEEENHPQCFVSREYVQLALHSGFEG